MLAANPLCCSRKACLVQSSQVAHLHSSCNCTRILTTQHTAATTNKVLGHKQQQHWQAAPVSCSGGGGSSGPPRSRCRCDAADGGDHWPDGHNQPIKGDDSQQQQLDAKHLLGLAAAGFVVLGLIQPWRAFSNLPVIDTSSHTTSIIVPVLNEAAGIVSTVRYLSELQPPPAEIIVVDGGSTDGTVQVVCASGLADKVLAAAKGRAAQMNAGAAAAQGDMLCFVHADTKPPKDLVAVMRRELQDPQTVLAGFVPSIEVPGRRLWLLSFHNFISTYYAPLLFRPLSYLRGLRGLFGDQTLFCRACDFQSVGGFDSRWRIMEDTDLCMRMHQAGPCYHHISQPHSKQHCRGSCSNKQPVYGSTTAAPSSMQADSTQDALGLPAACKPDQQQQQKRSGSSFVAAAVSVWQQWVHPRGRVKQVLDRVSTTSGRRLDAWGPLRATYIHVVIGAAWYFKRDPEQLNQLYNTLYTDLFR